MRVPIKLRRHSFSMLIEATTLSQSSSCQLITRQHSRTMRISHTEVEHSKVPDRCRIFNNSMLHMGSNDSNNKQVKEKKSGTKEISFLGRSNGYYCCRSLI